MNFLRTRCTTFPRYSIRRSTLISKQIHSSRIFARELNPHISPLEKEKEILILKERLFTDVPPKPRTTVPIAVCNKE